MRNPIDTVPRTHDPEAEDAQFRYGLPVILSNHEETWIGRFREPKHCEPTKSAKVDWVDLDGHPLGFEPLYWEPFKA